MATIRTLLEPEVPREKALSPLVETDKGPLVHVPLTIEQIASASVYHNTGRVFAFIHQDLVEAGILPKNTYARIFKARKDKANAKLQETNKRIINMKGKEKQIEGIDKKIALWPNYGQAK